MKIALVVPSLMIVGTLVACSRSDKNAMDEVGSTTITSAPLEPPQAIVAREPDHLVTRRVEAALAADPAMSRQARSVEVTVVEGIVTLSGPVVDAETKQALATTASRVRGVNDVLDKTQVAPGRDTQETADDQISYNLQRSLAFDPSVAHDGELVTIDVVKGVVTLRGTTSDDATREAVEAIAMQTPGVIAVKNQLVTSR
jgi:osmotically-inducible protein OsmY